MGSVQNAIDTDYSGAQIYFPSSCNRGDYSVFLGYYEIKIPPTVVAPTGSGFIGYIYYTVEGKQIVVYYCDGLLDVVQLINNDDTRITILE